MRAPDPHVAAMLVPVRRATLPLWLAAVAAVWVLSLYASTTLSIVSIWRNSETFAHGFVVLPIALYLMWRARARLLSAPLVPAWSALVALAGFGLLWFIGQTGGINAAEQFGVVGMALCAVWACWGHRATRALLFPLCFIFFAVPVGDFLVPSLMRYTADFTIAALRASGVPVYREGLFFVVPNGAWSVVEACSGIRYLIASIMVGALFAYLSYTSAMRRTLFMVAAVVVPLVANWLRAYLIVMLGYLSDNRIAVGVDHLVYGWAFFGIVIFLLFWIGSRWRQDVPATVAVPRTIPFAAARGSSLAVFAAACLLSAAWLPLQRAVFAEHKVPAVSLRALEARGGWTIVEEPSVWLPLYGGERARVVQTYRKDDARVTLALYYYAAQTRGAEMIQWSNRLVPGEASPWRVVTSAMRERPQPAIETEVGGPARALVWQWFWLGEGRVTLSARRAKLALLEARLLGRRDDNAAVFLIADGSRGTSAARTALDDFVADNRRAIDDALAGADR